MNTFNEFFETKKMFQAATPDINYPIPWAEWKELPEKYKASALYVTFFPAIVTISQSAIARSVAVSDSDVITFINLRLMNAVPIIEASPQKYTIQYIGKIIQNAIIDCDKSQNDKEHRKHNISNNTCKTNCLDGFETCDIFETIPDKDFLVKSAIELTAQIIVDNWDFLSEGAQNYILHILYDKKLTIPTQKKMPYILEELRQLFEKPGAMIYDIHLDCQTFEDVINNESLIEYADVEMPDGLIAKYVGEKQIYQNNNIKYVFEGDTCTYYFMGYKAKYFKVVYVKPIN